MPWLQSLTNSVSGQRVLRNRDRRSSRTLSATKMEKGSIAIVMEISPTPRHSPIFVRVGARLRQMLLLVLFKCQRAGLAWQRALAAPIALELCGSVPLGFERAQGRPGTGWHPWSACNKKARGRTTGSAENTRPSLRNGFNGFLRALPGDHSLVATVARETRQRLHGLSACIGAPGPHDFAVRARPRSSHVPSASIASPPHVS